jgi:molecular chaperone GrpE
MNKEIKNENTEIKTEILEDENTEVSSDNELKEIKLSSEVENEINDDEKFISLDEEFKSKMEAKVQEAESKAQESEDKFLRTYADFENIKKRLEREKYSAIDYASEKFAKDLLSPIDALQMAILSASSDIPAQELVKKLKEGIELTIKAFNSAFLKYDIIEVEYDEFNPEYHNAVMKIDSDEVDSGQIVQVMQKGYQYKDRLLREAMVSVAN